MPKFNIEKRTSQSMDVIIHLYKDYDFNETLDIVDSNLKKVLPPNEAQR